jgi:hypothetical protein
MVPVTFSLSATEPLFSTSSATEILKFLAMNSIYPREAINSSDTGRIFVAVKMDKGGIIRECKAFTNKDEINVPVLPVVVILGYKTSAGGLQSTDKFKKASSNEHLILRNECLRVTNKIDELNIPEWKDKGMEFALSFNFKLK